jgi:RNA polymerase sigma factor (sigma-70 family)
LITGEERDRVRQALTQLSATDRDILHLSFFEALTPVEIADRLGEPALRIRKRKSRALRRLRQAFLRGAETGHESRSAQTDL